MLANVSARGLITSFYDILAPYQSVHSNFIVHLFRPRPSLVPKVARATEALIIIMLTDDCYLHEL